MSTSVPERANSLEMASVLFMDIVGYSLEPMERQSGLLQQLQSIVRQTDEFKRAQERNELISLPTGDGMALVFFDNPTVPVECALKVAKALKDYPDIRLRMGVHTGPVYRIADINANMNVAGGGINMAQRVMDCGDAGHILLSSAVADVLSHLSGWPQYLKDLGEHPVKHGVKLHLYALCADEAGTHEIPKKLRPAEAIPAVRRKSSWPFLVSLGSVLTVSLVAAVGWKAGWFGSAAPASSVVPERTISYWITVQKFKDGKPFQAPFRLANDINFEANYSIQLGFSSPQPGYLYLINEGPLPVNGLPSYHVLFPSTTMNDRSPSLNANTDVLFPPAGKKFLRFDEEQGTEKLWLVWARQDVPELASALEAVSFAPKDGGSLADPSRVRQVQRWLTEHSASKPEVQRDESEKRTVLKVRSDVLVYLRRLEHH